jgi:hypothetical protein
VLVLVAGLTGYAWVALGATRPVARDIDIGWASSPNGKIVSREFGGIQELLAYDLSPGETFTFAGIVRNPGILPLTILGLDGTRATGSNPHVATIVGLGWVKQPSDDGRIQLLSAAPESVSVAWPLTLAPGDEAAIVVVGRGGPCAEPGGTGPVLPLVRYAMTYRVLGVERSEEIGLAAPLFVAAKVSCTVQVPGGTVTYGPAP